MEPVLIEDLIAVAVSGKAILFVREEDKDNPQALGMLVYCDNSMTCSFGLVQTYLKFWEMDIVEDNSVLHEYYQERIPQTFQGVSINNMMTEFKSQLEKWEVLEDKWLFESTEIYNFNPEQLIENQ